MKKLTERQHVVQFDKVITELGKRWKPDKYKDTIKKAWNHVLIQAFFFHLGKSLGFHASCEKYKKWDVAWVKANSYIQIEIELKGPKSIAKAFSKICRMSDTLWAQSQREKSSVKFSGILLMRRYLIGKTPEFEDYFCDFVLDPEDKKIDYPKNRALDLLVIDIEKEEFRHLVAGPGRTSQTLNAGLIPVKGR